MTIEEFLKKWLSYRDKSVLKREITKDEVREFTHMVRRLAALILLEQRLDANYASMTNHIYAWPNRRNARFVGSVKRTG
jgi:hypothetical protein